MKRTEVQARNLNVGDWFTPYNREWATIYKVNRILTNENGLLITFVQVDDRGNEQPFNHSQTYAPDRRLFLVERLPNDPQPESEIEVEEDDPVVEEMYGSWYPGDHAMVDGEVFLSERFIREHLVSMYRASTEPPRDPIDVVQTIALVLLTMEDAIDGIRRSEDEPSEA